MFHNNYRIYQTNFNEYSIEIEYWDSYLDKAETLNLDKLTEECMLKITDLLAKLDFDDRTPNKGE